MSTIAKWVEFGFINIQTFVKEIIKLNTDGLTVFEAESETAKSIAFKCIKFGTNYDKYDADVRRSIVRNWWEWKSTKDDGIFVLSTSEGYVVKFRFSINGMRTTAYKGKELIYDANGPAPEEICKLINIKPNKTLKRIINIIDNESPLLFDTSGEEYDSSILEVFLRHDELENRKTNSTELLRKIKYARKDKLKELTNTEIQLNRIQKYDNLATAKIYIEESEKLCNSYEAIDKAIIIFKDIINLKIPVMLDISSIEESLKDLKGLSEAIYQIENIAILQDDIITTELDIKSFEDSLKVLLNYRSLILEIKDIYLTKEPEREITKELKSCEKLFKELESLTFIIKDLQEILEIKEPAKENTKVLETAEGVLCNLQNQLKLIKEVSEIDELLDGVENLKLQGNNIVKEFELLLKNNPMCPTCGSILSEVLVS